MSVDIGLARKHKVFAKAETTAGTLVFPSSTDLILPAGNATINQTPAFVDSLELRDSLDVLDQFTDPKPPGDWALPMYLRAGSGLGVAPQGDPIWKSLQGKRGVTTIDIAVNIAADATSIPFVNLDGDRLPKTGVITVESEAIRYSSVVMATTTTGTLTVATGGRGYNSTTAAVHDGSGTTIEDNALTSVFYLQKTTAPSFSLWIKTDHFVQGLSGATATEAQIEISNTGAVMCSFSGNGMNMVYAGTSTFDGAASATTTPTVTDAKLYSVGARVYNETTGLTNGDAGFEILGVDVDTNTLTLGTAISATSGDVISGYLPEGEETYGDPIEAKDTSVLISGATAKFRTSTLTISSPKTYLTDEVGTEYPEEYVEEQRNISSDFNLYFKKEDAKYIYYGAEGVNMPFDISFGDTEGSIMELYLPKVKPSSPDVGSDGATMTLSMTIKALGTDGEDSCDIIWR